jgi:acid phosphatase type 7
VIAGAGDIATLGQGDEATARVLDEMNPDVVFTVGDNAYESATAEDFANWYKPTWGRHKAKTRPAAGNHEYESPGAAPYFEYFGAAAGTAGKGWYSYDIGARHVIVLNTNGLGMCSTVPCGAGSEQELWHRRDLAATTASCVAAFMHHPRFSAGVKHGDSSGVRALWQALYDYRADVVVAAHEHNYQRFTRMDPSGNLDAVNGLRSFVVGTGGREPLHDLGTRAGLEIANADTHGVLKLTLHPTSYDWQFIPVAGRTFTDSGSDVCGPGTSSSPPPPRPPSPLPPPPPPPPAPGASTVTFTPVADARVYE